MKRFDLARWLVLGLATYQGMRWIFEDTNSAFASSPLSSACGVLLAGAGLFCFSRVIPQEEGSLGKYGTIWCAASIAVWVSAPVLVFSVFSYRPGQNARTLSMALVPLVTAFLSHLQDQETESDLFSKLWPALAGLLGLLLLLPQPDPGSFRAWAGLLLAPLITGTTAVWALSPPSGPPPAPVRNNSRPWYVSVGLLMGGFLLFFGSGPGIVPLQSLRLGAMLLQAMSITLSLLLLLRLGATRWSAIFFLAPLIAMLGSLLLLRPRLDFRSILGLALLAIGGAYSLFRLESSGDHIFNIHRRTP